MPQLTIRHLYGDLTQRLRLLDPRRGLLTRSARIEVDQLVILVSLKRSGMHAVANWLLGLSPSSVLVNNSPLKRLGFSSPMSRTITTSPLPVRLFPGCAALAIDGAGNEYVRALQRHERLMVVLFQSQSLSHLARHKLVQGVAARQTQVLLQLRDPFNWSASFRAKSAGADDDRLWPAMWREYAREYTGGSDFLSGARRINYNRWVADREYRREIAEALQLPFNDAHTDLVGDHAGGSSFEGTRYQGRGSEMKTLERWRHYQFDQAYRDCLAANPDIVQLGLELFDLPEDLKRFASGCTRPVSGS